MSTWQSGTQYWEASEQHKAHMYFICWGLCLWHLIVQTQMCARSETAARESGQRLVLTLHVFFYSCDQVWARCVPWQLILRLMSREGTTFTFFLSLIWKIIYYFKLFLLLLVFLKECIRWISKIVSSLDLLVQTSTMLLMVIAVCLSCAEGKTFLSYLSFPAVGHF